MRGAPSAAAGREKSAVVGVDILGLITSGMYTDPLAVYREYIQNAADSVQDPGGGETPRIDISIATAERRVTIRDNGPGLSLREARRALIPVASSQKRGEGGRGFRGIGRLVGLVFGESVTFRTRSGAESPVVRVVWNGGRLRNGIRMGQSLEEVVENSVEVETVQGSGYPARFFEVSIEEVSRYAASTIMNRDVVRNYISEVCPVPFAEDFPYASEVSDLLGAGFRPFSVDVRLDGEENGVKRPHGRSVGVSEKEDEELVAFEKVEVAGLGGREWSALGWIAHTSYPGAIPKNRGVRCLRVRAGNIQIGGEDVFDHLFSEERFNRWCVAEIHVLEPALVPNARRDYFEPGPHLRNLENQLAAVCRRLERRCRAASKERHGKRRSRELLERAEGVLELASTGYLSVDRAQKLVTDAILEMSEWKQKYGGSDNAHESTDGLKRMEERLRSFRALAGRRIFARVEASEIEVYQEVFGVLAEVSSHPAVARRTIEAILERLGTRGREQSIVGGKEGRGEN